MKYRRNLLFVTGLLAAGSFMPALAEVPANMQCANVTASQIAGLFDRWNSSLATLDPAAVAANYAEDGVLLPTVSNDMRTNRTEITDYFKHFLTMKPQGQIDERVIKLGCNSATDAGIYTFTLQKDGKPTTVQARYTFTYELHENKWLISSHHSSVMPEKSGDTVQ